MNQAGFFQWSKKMGHGKHVTGSSYPTPTPPTPPPPVADYNVATNPELEPDCSCNYFYAGTWNGEPYYRRVDGLFFIWFRLEDEYGRYWISNELGNIDDFSWKRHALGPTIPGNYDGWGGGGTAVVSAGPH